MQAGHACPSLSAERQARPLTDHPMPVLCTPPSFRPFRAEAHPPSIEIRGPRDSTRHTVQGLIEGETQGAVVGGVNIMLQPGTTARVCLLQALSPVGRCKTFEASGDGYGRGEGFTVALLGWAPFPGVRLCASCWCLQL